MQFPGHRFLPFLASAAPLGLFVLVLLACSVSARDHVVPASASALIPESDSSSFSRFKETDGLPPNKEDAAYLYSDKFSDSSNHNRPPNFQGTSPLQKYSLEESLVAAAQDGIGAEAGLVLGYEASFNVGAGRSNVGRQATNGVTAIDNNTPQTSNLLPGNTMHYYFSHAITANSTSSTKTRKRRDDEIDGLEELAGNGTLLLEKREHVESRQDDANNAPRTVYISINTCLQPIFTDASDNANPPQLTLHVSTSNPNGPEGVISPDAPMIGPDVQSLALDQGYALMTITTSSDLYIGVSADKVALASDAAWNFELGVSVDQPYHYVNLTGPQLYMIDSDRTAALLVTRGLGETMPPSVSNFSEWITPGPPLSIFVQNVNDSSINGMRNSYCGLQHNAQLSGINLAPVANGAQLSITTTQSDGLVPEEQFYIPNLNASSQYYGILTQTGNSTAQGANVAGGGGVIYSVMNFTTKRLANCQVIFDLSFCTQVAYAVPANPATYPSPQSLAALYDNSTQQNYQYFDWALQQTPCNTTDTAQYSLVKTCDDCAAAYKTWLCAVSIPRCEDWPTAPGNFSPPIPGGYLKQPVNDSSAGNNAGIDPSSVHGIDGYTLPPNPPPDAVYLMPRNAAQAPINATPEISPVNDPHLLNWLATNSSRNNATIAGQVMPGPYMEVLPCQSLCFDIVRSCPASLSFACPRMGKGLQVSYGRPGIATNGGVMCSEPGVLWGFSAATHAAVPSLATVVLVVAFTAFSLNV